MLEEGRGLTAERGIVPADAGGAGAEERLRRAREAVALLDAEVEALAAQLADFGRSYEAHLGDLQRTLDGAERVLRRLGSLEDELSRLAERIAAGEVERPRKGRKERRRTSGRRRGARAAGHAALPETAESPAVILKRLYRQLARLLHPDLARGEDEARRLGALMAGVNAAYAAGDLSALQVMADRHGAGEPPPDLDPAEQRKHLEHRALTLERIAASLARERDRLRGSDTFRLMTESLRCRAAGEDFLGRSRTQIEEELAAARADALLRLSRVDRAAQALSRARSRRMSEIVKLGPFAARRAFDPLQESAVVRAGASRLLKARATADARELARWMEDAEPGPRMLTLLAFFAEEAGAGPPPSLEDAGSWARTWESLAGSDLAGALESLPGHLVLGARLQGQTVRAGVQLASAELATGVRLSLERERVAQDARRALAALGPHEACGACGQIGPVLHRLRTRGLDEHHGLGCASCGAILRSYWRYGEEEGLEALAPHALSLGLLGEVTVDLAGCTIGFQMLPAERELLTADRLRRLFAELYLKPYEIDLTGNELLVSGDGGPLSPRSRVGDAALRLEVARKELPAEELLEILRARIERRFKP